jgi:type I restriction enzyme S subunit
MGYPKAKIGKIAEVSGGKRLPKGESLVSNQTDHPYIRAQDIRDGRITFEEPVYLPEEIFQRIKRYTVKANDVCITIVGANVGDVGIVPPFLSGANLTENAIKLTQLRDCDPRFLNYSLLTDDSQSQMKLFAAGAAQPKLGLYKIKEVEIPVPPLSIQRKIASILSAYDDLIENNTRRIKILEEMARTIYREWFVEFRAPGVKLRKAAPEEKKVMGKDVFPVGWSLRKVTDVVWVNPPTKVPREGKKPFVPMSSLANDLMLINSIEYRTGNSGSKFKNGDTLFARITPCLENGKTAFVQFLPSSDAVAFGSTEFIVLRSQELCPEFVYLLARSDGFRDNAIKSMTGATGRQRVDEACFDKFVFACPDPQTIAAFSELMSPMFRNINILAEKNANLRRTRDLLLPRLISGELDVENVEVRMPALNGEQTPDSAFVIL